ncbi:unnamed protein product, partial [Brassica napus]
EGRDLFPTSTNLGSPCRSSFSSHEGSRQPTRLSRCSQPSTSSGGSRPHRVAAFAQGYVDQLSGHCILKHSGGPYGENLAMGSGDFSGVVAVELWVKEKANYNYASNTCNGVCGHYMQVVWRNTVRLGCAKARCSNGGTVISCNYDPQGNCVNERPY